MPPGPATVCIRPEHVRLHEGTGGAAGQIWERHFLGTLFRYHVVVGAIQLSVLTTDGAWAPGDTAQITLPEPVWVVR